MTGGNGDYYLFAVCMEVTRGEKTVSDTNQFSTTIMGRCILRFYWNV